MITLLMLLLLLFLTAFIYTLFMNVKLKELHSEKINSLRAIIVALLDQQKELNNKLHISNQFDANHKKEMKALGDEIVALQIVFLEIISNEKNN